MLNTNFAFINSYYEYLLLLFTQISNQLMKIQKQPDCNFQRILVVQSLHYGKW